MQERSPIIIFGAPRSGTTYLNELLNAHPDVFISHEIRLFAWLHDSLHVLTRQQRCLLGSKDKFLRHLVSAYPQMIRDFYAANWPNARYWGDKNPHYADPDNSGCLDTIAELFPGTKFIHVIRDGRDVVSSLIRKRHANGKPWANFEIAHGIWMNHVEIGTTFCRSRPASSCFEFKYEDLLRDEFGVSRRLFEFLEIEMHAHVRAFCQAQQIQRTPFSGPARDLSANPAISEWKQVFTEMQRRQSLGWLGPQLVALGYETESSLAQLREEVGHTQFAPGGFGQNNGMALWAQPNPVPSGSVRVKTTITWSTPFNQIVQIFVSDDEANREERLFIETASCGSTDVDWILPTRHYEFRMYAGKEKKELLAVLRMPEKH